MVQEKRMQNYLEKYYSDYKHKHQVPFFKKRVDFVYLDYKNRIIAIELKIKDWKNGINQIDSNQLFAHFSYLGVWHENIKKVPLDIFRDYGFGILSVKSNKIETIMEAKESKIRVKKFSNEILKKMGVVHNGLHF